MWIRSADGESMVNLSTVNLLQVEPHGNKYCLVAYDTGSTTGIAIGEYETRDEAMEQLELINSDLKRNGTAVHKIDRIGGAE